MQAIPARNSDICPPGSPLAAVTLREEPTWLTVPYARALLSDRARITTNVMVKCMGAGTIKCFALKGLIQFTRIKGEMLIAILSQVCGGDSGSILAF